MIRGGIVSRYYGSNASDGSETFDGWFPIFTVASDGERRVMQITDWTGGEGDKPTIAQTPLGSFTVTTSELSSGNATLTLGGSFLNITIAHTNSDGIDIRSTIDAIINELHKIRIVGDNGHHFEGTIASKINYTDGRARIRLRRAENPGANDVPSNFPVDTVITLTIFRDVYLGATGTVTVIADAVDIRGPHQIIINRSDMYAAQPGFLVF